MASVKVISSGGLSASSFTFGLLKPAICNDEETKRRRFDIRIIDEVIRLRGVTIKNR